MTKRLRIKTPSGILVPGVSEAISPGGFSVIDTRPLEKRYALVRNKRWEELKKLGYRIVIA